MKISLFPEKMHLINMVTYCEINVYNEKSAYDLLSGRRGQMEYKQY